MVKMAVFQFDETQTERFISFHDYEEFSGFKTSLSEMKRKALGRKGRHASRRSQRHLRGLRRRFGRNSSKMEGDPFEGALDNVQKYGFSRSRGARAQARGPSTKLLLPLFDLLFSFSIKRVLFLSPLCERL